MLYSESRALLMVAEMGNTSDFELAYVKQLTNIRIKEYNIFIILLHFKVG